MPEDMGHFRRSLEKRRFHLIAGLVPYSAASRVLDAANKSTVVVVENRGTAPGFAAMEVVDSMHSRYLRDFAFRHIEDDQTIKLISILRTMCLMWRFITMERL